VFQPHVSRDDCLLSRWTRAGFLYAQAQWPALSDSGDEWPWQRCGVLQLADGDANELRVADTAARQAYPHDYAQYVTHEAASALAGAAVGLGGWWFACAGWVRPGAIVAMQLAAARDRLALHLKREVRVLTRDDGIWNARDADGAVVAQAPIVVLANADQAVRLIDAGIDPLSYPLRLVRGQQSYLPAPPFAAPRAIVGGDGYVLPAVDGIAIVGATYDLDRSDLVPDPASHGQNLARAARMLPGSTESVDIAHIVGIRCVARDRMPMLGALVDLAAARESAATLTGAHLVDLPRLPGIYAAFAFASRGLAWTLLAGELLAAQLEGEALPVEGALVDAMDPGRFMLHRLRRKLP
jgi:tRNA 5-methylaminomethyl-2-thiouridine biosynthesis bifunctional protein